MSTLRTAIYLSLLLTIQCYMPVFAQQPDTVNKTNTADVKEKYPQFQFHGLLQTRYVASTTGHIDVDGMHHTQNEYTGNSFDLKRVRVQVEAQVGKHTAMVVLANLAEFKADPQNKVLENAYLKYSFSPALTLIFGQFRPGFGIEETYPADIIKSVDYSNQYYEFAKDGWTSFEQGAGITGNINIGPLPTQYSVSVVNGNGRNQAKDKDGDKQLISRMVFTLLPKQGVKLGLNGGYGQVLQNNVYAAGVDLTGNLQLGKNWNIDLQAEAKQGTNHALYYSVKDEDRISTLSNYAVRGFYFLPDLRHTVNCNNLSSIECSVRYEYLDVNYKLEPNPRHSITPMISLEFIKNYDARAQLGLVMERYRKETDNTLQHNSNMLVLQLQSRF